MIFLQKMWFIRKAGVQNIRIAKLLSTGLMSGIHEHAVLLVCARGKVLIWDIKQFFHKGNQTIVEWYFKNEMNAGSIEEFDGISLVEWTDDNKIKSLKEFGCNRNNYNPYQYGDQPRFRDEKANWF